MQLNNCLGLTASLLLAAAVCLPATARADAANPRSDEAIAAEIDRFLSPYFNPNEPGATVIVTREGKPIFRKAYGLANIEKKTPMQPEMVLRIASMTKQFTAVAVMILVEDGKLKLDDDFTKHLPGYPKPKKKITIDQLLTHTSGIPGYTEMDDFGANRAKDVTVAQMIDRFKDKPLTFTPGTKMRYNNSGFFLLGAIIEHHSGMRYADFVAQRIFEPLGMKDTAYEGSERSGNQRVNGYRGGIKFELAEPLSSTQPYSAGALVSTVDDLAKWDAAISQGKLLKAASWKKLFEPINVPTGNATKVARGWFATDVRGSEARWHSGGIQGFMSDGLRLPNEKVYSAILVNTESARVSPTVLNQHVAAIAIGKPYGFAGVSTPFYLRGSMNKWGTTQQMQRRGANEFATDVVLDKGEHEFKFGSKDWSTIDFGGGPPESRVTLERAMPMWISGANVKFAATQKARYRFILNITNPLWPEVRVEMMAFRQ
jgi:D-alanyl-D-alanine carboxypeptidase